MTLYACITGLVKAPGRKRLDEGWETGMASSDTLQVRIPRCPRCGTNAVSVAVKSEIWFRDEFGGVETKEHFAQCGVCSRGIILDDWDPNSGNPQVLPLAKDGIPEHLPENVERFFRQGIDNLERGNWDAAGSMFRKTLESALKHRFSDNARSSLADRIKKAAEDRNLTPEMAEWADQIRFWGNDAAHEDEPFTEEETRQMGEFTELFLTYLFTLPEKLTRARNQE